MERRERSDPPGQKFETIVIGEKMETLRQEIIESQKVRSDLLKWKLFVIAGICTFALSGKTDGVLLNKSLTLSVIPFACSYIDLLCRHLSIRIKSIGLYIKHGNHNHNTLRDYEKFYDDMNSTSWNEISLESIALVGLTVFISIAIIPLGVMTSETQNWVPVGWPTLLFYSSSVIGIVASMTIHLFYSRLSKKSAAFAKGYEIRKNNSNQSPQSDKQD